MFTEKEVNTMGYFEGKVAIVRRRRKSNVDRIR